MVKDLSHYLNITKEEKNINIYGENFVSDVISNFTKGFKKLIGALKTTGVGIKKVSNIVFNSIFSKFKPDKNFNFNEADEEQLRKVYKAAIKEFPNIISEEVIQLILKHIKQQARQRIKMYGEDDIYLEYFPWKKLFSKFKKGFIPSSTFYPTLKYFNEFIKVVTGEQTLQEVTYKFTMEEVLIVLGAVAVYLFVKTMKDILVIKKEVKKEKEKKKKHEEKRKKQIEKRIIPLGEKLKHEREKRKKIEEVLWSQEQLEKLIESKIRENLKAI